MPAMRAALAAASAKAHRYHCRVAALLLRLQELDAAGACLDAARRAFPDSVRVRLLLGELDRYRGMNDEAVRCYDRRSCSRRQRGSVSRPWPVSRAVVPTRGARTRPPP